LPAVAAPALVLLAGPTAAGKTAVALPLARLLDAEILSIDSRQAYRWLDIGTAKPTSAERAAVPHHLLDLFDPRETASAEAFARHYRAAVALVHARGRRALAVGGSGLYFDACLGRLDSLPPSDPGIRAEHQRIREREGPEALHRLLTDVDPPMAAILAPRDFQRVSRALEVHALTGRRLSRLHTRRGRLDLSAGPPMALVLRERAELDRRIAARAEAMLAAGLLEEVRGLAAQGIPLDAPGLEAIGYGEFARALAGEIALDEAMRTFVLKTRRYAKRQMTWFRNRYRGVREIVVPPGEEPAATAQRVMEVVCGGAGEGGKAG
jgi:tRNA dimethylallyltransferase